MKGRIEGAISRVSDFLKRGLAWSQEWAYSTTHSLRTGTIGTRVHSAWEAGGSGATVAEQPFGSIMDRRNLLLAILACSDGRPYSPVQIQKAMFLVCSNLPGLIDRGPKFHFAPYDYGPFDSDVYMEAQNLRAAGDVVIAPSAMGQWQTYSASDQGSDKGRRILNDLDPSTREYISEVSRWVRSQSFSSLVRSIYEAYPEMRARSIFRD